MNAPAPRPSAPFRHSPLLIAVSVLGAVGCVAGFVTNTETMLSAWLFGWGTVACVCLGMLFLVLLHHVTDSAWSTVFRRWAEHFASALPLMAILGLPLVIGMGSLYPWAQDSFDAHGSKAVWLSKGFFAARVVMYLAVWAVISHLMVAPSRRQDQSADPGESTRLRRRSAPLLVAFGLTFSFGAIDLFMTLDPHWYSTIYGVYVFAQSVVATLAILILFALVLRRGGHAEHVPTSRLGDLGTLAFGMSCFWAYIAFSQYFLIWFGNLPEETVWFAERFEGGWLAASVVLPVLLWLLPFVTWMSFRAKRQKHTLAPIAGLIVAGHVLGMYWLVVPSSGGALPARLWMDVSALLLIGGVAGYWVARAFSAHGVTPINDPRLPEALGGEQGSHA